MSGLVIILGTILILWMSICAICGFKVRLIAFLGMLIGGLALNMAWMFWGLNAHPLEPNALFAQAALTLHGLSSFGTGWIVGRFHRRWVESRVTDAEV